MINRLTSGPRLTLSERTALRTLRIQYHANHHMFSAQELARLRFLRWIIQTPAWDADADRVCPKPEPQSPRQASSTWMPGSSV